MTRTFRFLLPALVSAPSCGALLTLLFPILALTGPGVCASGNRIVGYYASWNAGSLPYDKIEYSNLTDIVVAFGIPNSDGTITYDAGIPFPQLVADAHASGVKVLVSLGGASSGQSFSAATTDSIGRAKLISSVVNFLEQNQYDGVDIDWETPSNSTETLQLTDLVREMRGRFIQVDSSWLITMAIPATGYGGKNFDIVNLVKYVDWFNIMCYDFVGSWSGYSGHNSPLYMSSSDPNQAGSDSSAIAYWVSRGGRGATIQKDKLVLGIPFYSVKFDASGLYRKMTDNVTTNPYYAGVMDSLSSGWSYHWDITSLVPYLMNEDTTQFITFEDTNSVRLKVQFAVRQNLGGVMIWELSQDFYKGIQPLLETISSTMKSLTGVVELPYVANDYRLYDNYPNPFNPSTVIKFSIPTRAFVKIAVYDALGRRVRTLVDGAQKAGVQEITFDGTGLSSGVYFCLMTSENYRTAIKMLLLK